MCYILVFYNLIHTISGTPALYIYILHFASEVCMYIYLTGGTK